MGEQQQTKTGWRQRRREKKRLKLERTGDSAEKRQGDRHKGGPPTVKDNAQRAGLGGFVSGGF